MAGDISTLLLRAEDKDHWSVVLHSAFGENARLPAATPGEHLIAAAEVDYSAYRQAIQRLRMHHVLLENCIDISLADFEDFVTEALLLPSILQEIDPVSFFALGSLLDQCLRGEDDGSASFFIHSATRLLYVLEEPIRAQVYLRNALEIACDSMERATQWERYEKLIGACPELAELCDPDLLQVEPEKGQVYVAYSIFGLYGLEFALYFH